MLKRLAKELEQLTKDNTDSMCAYPINDSLTEWNVYILGPNGTGYDGGLYHAVLKIPSDYPLKPPNLKFKTQIFHPNISTSGDVCIDILKTQWSPALGIHKILLSISSLLSDPNPDSPLNGTAGDLYKRHRDDFIRIANEMRDKHAMNTVIDRGIIKDA